MKYSEQQKSQIVREAEDEIAIMKNGVSCAPKHVKRYCRERIMKLEWIISRVHRNLPIDNYPSTMYIPPRIT